MDEEIDEFRTTANSNKNWMILWSVDSEKNSRKVEDKKLLHDYFLTRE